MATDHVLDGLRLNPDEVAEREFAHGFRGYDVHEVRSYLRAVAGEMARMVDAARLSEVDAREGEAESGDGGPLSRERLVEMVGDEAARVLHAAEDASAAIRSRAEDNVARMLREARAEAVQIRTSADQARADLLETSEAARAGASDDAAAILAQAEVDAQASRDAVVEQGKAMLAEAQGARGNVLRDLALKRKGARRELAQLRAGIDQLHESYDELRSMLDTSSMVVDGAVDDARRAAADAAHRFDKSDGEDDLAAVKMHVEGSGYLTGSGRSGSGSAPDIKPIAAIDDLAPAARAEVVEAHEPADHRVADGGSSDADAPGGSDIEVASVSEALPEQVSTTGAKLDSDDAETELVVGHQEVGDQDDGDQADGGRADDDQAEVDQAVSADDVAERAALVGVAESVSGQVDENNSPVGTVAQVDSAGQEIAPSDAGLADDDTNASQSMEGSAQPTPRVVPVDQVPSAADTAEARRSERRTVFRRESTVDRSAALEGGGVDESASPDGDSDDESVPAALHGPQGDSGGAHDGDHENRDVKRDTDVFGDPDGFAELPDLLDDGPVPPAPPAPQLFGRRDNNIDELFARIRTSRETAVAKARGVLDNVDASERSQDGDAGEAASTVQRSADELFAEVDDVQNDMVADASRILKRVLADELNEVLDACRRADGVESVAELIPAAGVAVYGASLVEILQSAAVRGANNRNAAIDVSTVTEMVSSEIGGALRSRVQTYLIDEDGLDQRIRSAYREWRRDRADEVAVLAIVRAFNLGVVHDLGNSALVRWALRDGTCIFPDCGDNALATGVRSTDEFPTGHTVAPMGAGCRCLVVPADQ